VRSQDETDDQRRARGLPPNPRFAGEGREGVTPPTPVNVSFGLWIGSGLVFVVGFAITLLNRQQIIDRLVAQDGDERITAEQIATGTTVALWVLLIGSIVFAILFGLFAYKAREGTRSARTVLTVLAVVSVLLTLWMFPNIVTFFALLLAFVALLLMYLPSVSDYFPKPPKRSSPRS
jgi:hypothetical protein